MADASDFMDDEAGREPENERNEGQPQVEEQEDDGLPSDEEEASEGSGGDDEEGGSGSDGDSSDEGEDEVRSEARATPGKAESNHCGSNGTPAAAGRSLTPAGQVPSPVRRPQPTACSHPGRLCTVRPCRTSLRRTASS